MANFRSVYHVRVNSLILFVRSNTRIESCILHVKSSNSRGRWQEIRASGVAIRHGSHLICLPCKTVMGFRSVILILDLYIFVFFLKWSQVNFVPIADLRRSNVGNWLIRWRWVHSIDPMLDQRLGVQRWSYIGLYRLLTLIYCYRRLKTIFISTHNFLFRYTPNRVHDNNIYKY